LKAFLFNAIRKQCSFGAFYYINVNYRVYAIQYLDKQSVTRHFKAMCEARARKKACEPLCPARGALAMRGEALGPESIRDALFWVRFLGKQKRNNAVGREMFVAKNPIVYVILCCKFL